MLEHFRNDGMERREGDEGLLIGGILAGLGFLRVLDQREFAKEDFAELLGRADVERSAGVLVDGSFQSREVGAQFFADFFERGGIEADAFVFHGGENGQERRFDLGEDAFLARFPEERGEFGVELKREVGAFHGAAGCELIRIGRFHLGEEILLARGFFLGGWACS